VPWLADAATVNHFEQLTRQEGEVVRALLSGSTNREMADRLFVSVKTIETHLTRVYRKLGCRSRNQVIAGYYAGTLPALQLQAGAPSGGSDPAA